MNEAIQNELVVLARRVIREVTCFCMNESCVSCAAKKILMDPQLRPTLRAGDVVRYLPNGEDWVLACDQELDSVMPAGWPSTKAAAADCLLIKPASDEEHARMLRNVAAMTRPDPRRAAARHQLAQLEERS